MDNRHLSLYLKVTIYWQKILDLFQPIKNEDNVIAVVYRLTKLYKIHVTKSYINEFLKPHKDYPSLKSICHFFDDVRVQHYAIRIDFKELLELKKPFLAHLSVSNGRIILVYTVDKEYIVYSDSIYGKKVEATQQFLKYWKGVVILIDPSKKSGQIDYKSKKNLEIINHSLIPATFGLLIASILYGVFQNNKQIGSINITQIIFWFCHFIGLLFSLQLLINELNVKTKLSEKLCHLSSNSNCDVVSKSKAAKIFGIISWADIGIAWFTSGLVLSFTLKEFDAFNILAMLSLTTLPFSAFSIAYQKFVIKKWCLFCLVIQMILLGETMLLFRYIDLIRFEPSLIFLFVIILSIIFLIEFLIKQRQSLQNENEHLQLELLKIRCNPVIFMSILMSKKQIALPDFESTIVAGNLKSKSLITVFLSLHCSGCSKRFLDIITLINSDINIKFQLIFYPPNNELSQKMIGIIYHLAQNGCIIEVLDTISEWYRSDTISRRKLVDSFHFKCVVGEIDFLIKKCAKFFEMEQISHVPALFVNGYPFPEMYALIDVKYYVEDIETIAYEMCNIEL